MNAYMALALAEAKKGVENGEGGPFGAVIVKDGEVIASGHNEVLKSNDPTAHAEVVVIRKASALLKQFHLSECTLYVTGEPCPMCFSAIHWAHLKEVIYATTKEEAAAVGFDDVAITEILQGDRTDTIPFVHQPQRACSRFIESWSDAPTRVDY